MCVCFLICIGDQDLNFCGSKNGDSGRRVVEIFYKRCSHLKSMHYIYSKHGVGVCVCVCCGTYYDFVSLW